MIDRVKDAYDTNLKILKDKGNLVSAGIVLTGIEVGLVAVAIIIRKLLLRPLLSSAWGPVVAVCSV